MRLKSSSISIASQWRARPSRHGFTLIELLVVIGIILLLMGIFYAGVKIVTAQAKERDTRTMLETCKTMFENYRSSTHLTITISPNVPNVPKGATWAFVLSNGAMGSQVWALGQESPLGLVTPQALDLGNPNRVLPRGRMPDALQNTEAIMQAMLTVPENQTIFNNLPQNKVIKDALTNVPLILDGWGNPIFFCPGGGMTAIWVDPVGNGNATQVVTSEGVKPNGYNPLLTTYVPLGSPISNQPFFVSAGPDEDLSNGHGWTTGSPITSSMNDDNIYSFK